MRKTNGADLCAPNRAGMRLTIREMAVFGMLGAVMFASKMLMELLPNIHLLGVLTVAYTVVYRKKALYPIYIYVLINGIFCGFAAWWAAYLYVWTILWGMVMLLPQSLPEKIKPLIYMAVCAVHGFLFGTLCAPAQALLFGLNFEGTLAWIAAGLPFDFIHGVSNFLCGTLIVPIACTLRLAERNAGRR